MAFIAVFAAAAVISGCDNYETYGEKKDKERKAIRQFIRDSSITVIQESQFIEQDYVTRHTDGKNEFVYLNNSGVYMQIVRDGCGSKLQNGENADLLIRFVEVSIYDSAAIYNITSPYDPDVMNVRVSGSSFEASFTSGIMYSTYGSSVPPAWLVPLSYVKVGRPHDADDEIAKVRLIVPHSQGHSIASSYVYPYYYEISYQRKIELQ